ncbi:MAG: IS4 family transposase [Chloroflexi bacterium]|nr:MAG: IS4 family transposase [Chloroflexota bacterium]
MSPRFGCHYPAGSPVGTPVADLARHSDERAPPAGASPHLERLACEPGGAAVPAAWLAEPVGAVAADGFLWHRPAAGAAAVGSSRLRSSGAGRGQRLPKRLCAAVAVAGPAPGALRGPHLGPLCDGVVALDESGLDRVKRWVNWLREVPQGDSRLLPGRLVGLFDVRLQQWVRLDVLLDATADGKVHARAMLRGLATGSLLLFDLGYFSFPWWDELTQAGYWYLTRQRAKTRYQVVHILYQADGVFDALVSLGGHSSDRAGQLVRLVCFRRGSQQYCYLTNVLDPAPLPLVDIARLYARRWEIELAFRELKEHLKMPLLWSAKLGVIYQQIWASLILAHLLHASQVELAAQAEVEPFDVSLALLSRHLPRVLLHTADPMGFLVQHGRAMGLIRPSSRQVRQAPVVPLQQISYPPPELLQPRQAHSAHRKCGSCYAAQS